MFSKEYFLTANYSFSTFTLISVTLPPTAVIPSLPAVALGTYLLHISAGRSLLGSEYQWSLLFWDSCCHGNSPNGFISLKAHSGIIYCLCDRLFTLTSLLWLREEKPQPRLSRLLDEFSCHHFYSSHRGTTRLNGTYAAPPPRAPWMFHLCFLKHNRCVASQCSSCRCFSLFTPLLSSFLSFPLIFSQLIMHSSLVSFTLLFLICTETSVLLSCLLAVTFCVSSIHLIIIIKTLYCAFLYLKILLVLKSPYMNP